jgi:hypothetical protein
MKNENGFISIDPIIEPSEDKVYRLANAVASIVPTGSNIFQAIFTNPIQNRTNAWMEDVEAKIVELVKLGEIDLEALAKRPEFSANLDNYISYTTKLHQNCQSLSSNTVT